MVPVLLVPPVMDSPLTPPPPFTSFFCCRSRTSMCPFFSRRQTDRITLILGSLFCASTANYFVAAFALAWPTNPIIANIFTALSLFEIARVLVRFDHIASLIVNAESRHHVNRCGASRDRLQIGGEVSRTETVGGVRRSRQDCE
jgi:hypothetical protein